MSTKFTAQQFTNLEAFIKECYASNTYAWRDYLATVGNTGSAIVDESTYSLIKVIFNDRYEIWTTVDGIDYLVYSHPRSSFQFLKEEENILKTEIDCFCTCYRHTFVELFGEDRSQVSHQQCDVSKIRYDLSYVICPVTGQDQIYLTFLNNGARRSVYKTQP